MMNFRTIKDAITTILGNEEAGRYKTIGFQRQVKAAEEVSGNNRQVTVYYYQGQFRKSGGRPTGPNMHDITYRIELTVSSPAKLDLSVINNPASTPAQIAAAIDAMQEAAQLADISIDELFDIVYQILMDARNIDYSLPAGTLSNRWLDSFVKDEPRPRGSLVVLTGIITLTLSTSEQVPGDTGETGANIINQTFDIKDNLPDIAGVLVDNS